MSEPNEKVITINFHHHSRSLCECASDICKQIHYFSSMQVPGVAATEHDKDVIPTLSVEEN
jgi:hypothetical protein